MSDMQHKLKVASAIEAVLLRFDHLCDDPITMKALIDIASTPARWAEAKVIFNGIRAKTLEAERRRDHRAISQYVFEEVCAKSIYNLSMPSAPFDADSADHILPNAEAFGRLVGVSDFGASSQYLRSK